MAGVGQSKLTFAVPVLPPACAVIVASPAASRRRHFDAVA